MSWKNVKAVETIASGASSCIRCPQSGISINLHSGMSRANSRPRSIGIHSSSTPHRTRYWDPLIVDTLQDPARAAQLTIQILDLVCVPLIHLRDLAVKGSLSDSSHPRMDVGS